MPETRTERRVLGGAVKRLRESYGWKTDPFSKKVGISKGYLCNIEANRKTPTLPVIKAIARELGVDVNDITYLIEVPRSQAAA